MKALNKFRISIWKIKIIASIILLALSYTMEMRAGEGDSCISFNQIKGWFSLLNEGKVTPILISSEDYPGVLKVAQMFKQDIEQVTGILPEVYFDQLPKTEKIILIGTLDKSSLLKRLVDSKKFDISELKGKREKFIRCRIANPFPGIKEAIVIAGSDKRGTIYGMFDLSSQIGVSPWYWWADVPVKKQTSVYINPAKRTLGEPAVRYRGFFINDEAPALSGWTHEKFGGFNHKFYEKVFELLLRLKANYLWPAMWGNAFNDDDTINPQLADEYGIVMGTSHHEPMLRAQQEWKRYGKGEWNYDRNDSVLRQFWREGIRHMKKNESIVTVGMRGDGDMPMTEASNIALLEKIVSDQRTIISEVTGNNPSEQPQAWALYKEVQDYYEKGMRVPDDVTLLLCDDNWGNIRLLPDQNEKPRSGGYGIYYHFDYVGDPRNYKWINTIQISRVWEQMHLAYEYGVDRIWIVNVGDIKPMELPISFFMDYAWSPKDMPVERMQKYTESWAKAQFGEKYASRIAKILTEYTTFNSRRKPELLSPETYSLVNYQEAEDIVVNYNLIAKDAEVIYSELSPEYRDAFYQLVLFPVKACANLNELYVTVAKNRQFASEGRSVSNKLAEQAAKLFRNDSLLSIEFNKKLLQGKWNHMMDQTHIGYTYWQQPEVNAMPKLQFIKTLPATAGGISMEGSNSFFPLDSSLTLLQVLDPYRKNPYSFHLFTRGSELINYSIVSKTPWLHPSVDKGEINNEKEIYIDIDWTKTPSGKSMGELAIQTGEGRKFVLKLPVFKPVETELASFEGFIESNGYISIEAEHYSRAVALDPMKWTIIPDFGRTLSGITLFPVNWKNLSQEANSAKLEYDIFLFNPGAIKVHILVSPTQNFLASAGLRYSVSFDEDEPVIVNINADRSLQAWEKSVADNINETVSNFSLKKQGKHVLNFKILDPGIVLQKIIIETSPIGNSYLGPPESLKGY